ncbi:imidazole glycerol phosphate synthase subunit HisH [Aureliella helgolandensis]|uniref:Imidazole glycerol phosphate synthase subunit HisH n=1 Tax=Aureliella helgolandensis TaxID=2527968 RepID=A0A518G2L1_9BACT|nr:imidazole glycerol phosphate synthase subunit HisH [Aureliella helgolandensis]QDV22795.1 Imidazole glycerol phosphate synthase subunit HisH 1 [Aureliella helgolandensis]
MSKPQIAIVDYQMGNLRSVQKALEHVGFVAEITSDPARVEAADKVILPGVGAFGDAIAELHRRELVSPIQQAISAGKPFLGICLGLQMLFDVGFEGGEHVGMGVLPGRVEKFGTIENRKVPHMGWNQVSIAHADCPLLKDIPATAHFYFVHSYYVVPENASDVWLTCDYGQEFCAAVWRENLFATQFHPEKSQRDGLQLLKNFAEL